MEVDPSVELPFLLFVSVYNRCLLLDLCPLLPFVNGSHPLLVFTCRGCLKWTHTKMGGWKHKRVVKGMVWMRWPCHIFSLRIQCYIVWVKSSPWSLTILWDSLKPCQVLKLKEQVTNFVENNLFIMKHVMVERGARIYLSGLWEKYFGEYFLMLLCAWEM